MKVNYFIIITVLWQTVVFGVSGQHDSVNFYPSIEIETGVIGSLGKQTPFWMVSNTYGKYALSRAQAFAGINLERNFVHDKNLGYSYGVEGFARLDNSSGAYLHQWYVGGKLWFTRIWAGAREEVYGNQDKVLSSGGLLWSGNARPMPKVMIDVPEFTAVPFTFKLIEFKGGMSHGWFEDDRYVKNTWLHHKYGYVRFGGWLPVKFHYGMHHFAQWGGVSTRPDIGQLPATLEDFKYVFLTRDRGEDPDVPWGEWFNKIGNHIGSRNFGLDVTLEQLDAGLYWQTIFEDGSGKAYRNIRDGLFGLYFKTNKGNDNRLFSIERIVFEYFNTTDQSGTYNRDSTGYETGGNDNYFNHGIYKYGWTIHDMTIGTPLITSPIFNDKLYTFDHIRNNKSRGVHVGLAGTFLEIKFQLKYTCHENFGTNYHHFETSTTSHSGFLKLSHSLKKDLQIKGYLAGDISGYYGNNVGLGFSLVKQFF